MKEWKREPESGLITSEMGEATSICHNSGMMEHAGRGVGREKWQQDAPGRIRKEKLFSV